MSEPVGGGPMRIGLAGFGAWGQMHARALAQVEDVEVGAIFCHGDASAAAAREQHPGALIVRRYDEMLARAALHAVVVAVPNDLHATFAIAALEAGCDVVLEKPLGTSLAQCDAVVAAAAAAGRQVAVDHELRVSQQWGRVRRLIAAGEIGAVAHQHVSLFRHPFRPGSGGWRRDPGRVGSWSLEELVHFVDLVLWYGRENGPPARLVAQASSGSGLADTVSALIEWPDGATALVTQCLAGFQHHTLAEIAGREGAIRTWWAGAFDRTERPDFSLALRRRGSSEVETIEIPISGEIFELETFLRRALAGFHSRGAEHEGGDIISLAEARRAVAICLAIEQGAREGAPLDLADLA